MTKAFRAPPDPFPAQYSHTAKGNCLGSIIPDGSILFHDVEAPIKGGDIVTVWLREESFKSGSQIRTKILIASSSETITLAALNPPEQHVFPRKAFHAVHKVLAIKEPSGAIRDLRTTEACRDLFARALGQIGAPCA